MNLPKKGPEIKFSELKIPDFVYDLYYDLKERHLLPLVVIMLVALVAVPIFLESAKHSSDQEPDATLPAATGSSVAAGEEALVVSRTEPGLRELRRRFKHYRALDPFAEKGTSGTASETAQEETAEVSGAAGEPAPPTVEEPPIEATVSGGEAGPTPLEPAVSAKGPTASPAPEQSHSDSPTRARYASNAIDVRIVSIPQSSPSNAGANPKAKSKPKAQVRRNLPELTMLPARATPAVAFMGTSRDGKKALFLVSSDVVSIFGEGNCVIGSQTCQLLALEPGLPETFVYGPREHTYRIQLLKINRTLSAKPRRAALGATRHGKSSKAPNSEAATPTKPAGRGEAAE